MSNNNFNKNLNTVLTDSHYPHLTNNLFKNLVLPYGLIVKNPENIKKNLSVDASRSKCALEFI